MMPVITHFSLARATDRHLSDPVPLLQLNRLVVHGRQHLRRIPGDHYVDDARPVALGESSLKCAADLTRFINSNPMAPHGLGGFGLVGFRSI